jgi:hypothetical protein
MLALHFLVVGNDSVFTVEIDEEEQVGILKDKIKNEKELFQKYLLAKKDGHWLRYDDEDVSKLKKKNVPSSIRNKYCTSELKMEPTFSLKKYFSGTNIPKDEKYHDLVVVPERKDQDVPQSNIWAVKPEFMDLMKRYTTWMFKSMRGS